MTDEQADIILSDFKKQDNFKILEDISRQVNEMMRSNLETKFLFVMVRATKEIKKISPSSLDPKKFEK